MYYSMYSYVSILTTSPIHTSNSMGSSEIWDKYHKCCIENEIFHSALPHEILLIFNATRVAFIPNLTAIPMLFPVNTEG